MAHFVATCQLCGGPLKKTSIGRSFLAGALFGLCFILVGVILCFTGIGALLGIPLILVGLFYGSKRKKVLRCRQCRAVFDRA